MKNDDSLKGMNRLNDWEKTGFYSAFLQMKPGDIKAPIGQYTKDNRNHLSLEQVQRLPRYLGILAPNVVLLDADDDVQSENLLKLIQGENLPCMVTQREGGRGIHALFIDDEGIITNNGTKVSLACGIVVDIKSGRSNGLECLKWDGVEREIIHNVKPYQNLPKYMKRVHSNMDFANMDEGDGRNQALFNYILTLQDEGFEVDETRHCIRRTNKYIIKTPVSDSELDVILRDDAFKKKSFYRGTTFLFDRFAQSIRRKYHIVKINGQLHIYMDGHYTSDKTALKLAMYSEIPNLKKSQKSEVLEVLETICETVRQTNINVIGFRNGNLNIDTGDFSPCSPDVIITNLIPRDYNPNAYDEATDNTLNKISCNDPEVRRLVEEVIGSGFYRAATLAGGKAFIFTGGKSNGKSTLLDAMKHLYGETNTSTLDIRHLDDRFKTIRLYRKLVNIGDDISDKYNDEMSTFKKIVTGQSIEVEQKGEPGFSFEPYAKMIFAANEIPRIKDPTEAAQRRLIIVPLNAQFSETDEDFDPEIKFKLQRQQAMEYLIVLGIEGLKRVLKNKHYSECKVATDAKEEYRRENSPILTFLEENGVDGINNERTSDVLLRFNVFCHKNNFREIGQTKLTRDLKQQGFSVEQLNPPNQKAYKIYVWKG